MALPNGEDLISLRDRAIIKFYLYSGARLHAGCQVRVTDFHRDDENPTIRLNEKVTNVARSACMSPQPVPSPSTSKRPS